MRSRSVAFLPAVAFLTLASASAADWQAEWRAFRSAHPYHAQLVAVSQPGTNGERVLIVSEPPPHLTAADIASADPVALRRHQTATHPVGYDGWVKDFVAELPILSEDELRELVEKVHIRMFGTAYKSVAVPTRPTERRSAAPLDLHVSSATLNTWLIAEEKRAEDKTGIPWGTLLIVGLLGLYGLKSFSADRSTRHVAALLLAVVLFVYKMWPVDDNVARRSEKTLFTGLEGGDPQTVNSILASGAPGLYLSEPPGLVVWNVDRHKVLNTQLRAARQFALDSDLVLGAISHGNRVAVIAREREISADHLPPLRAETIVQLAAVDERELAQSYERNDFLAGRFEPEWDWAPIYLSGALVDSEYGSLLNITDQLLKSWSLRGLVKYIRFEYPSPGEYPFEKPLNVHAKTNSVTFNWNTKGAGYITTYGDYDIYASNRTGALPVDYLGSENDRLREAEDTGYEYFAKRSDPNLVRVVQYAQLYQIFRHFQIRAEMNFPHGEQETSAEVRAAVQKSLERLLEKEAEIITAARSRSPELALAIEPAVRRLRDYVALYDGDALERVADAIANPRTWQRRATGVMTRTQFEATYQTCGALGGIRGLLERLAGMTPEEGRASWLSGVQRETTGWIHTPSIVQSRTTGELSNASGGHNLDSAITRFRRSPDLGKGEIRLVEENGVKVVLYSPADEAAAPEVVRAVARNPRAGAPDVEASARRAIASARIETRPMHQVLNSTRRADAASTRGFGKNQVEAALDGTGWRVTGKSPGGSELAFIQALPSEQTRSIMIDRTASGFLIYDGSSRRVVEASTQPGAIDVLASLTGGSDGRSVHLHLRGFSTPRHAQGFSQSAELQLAGVGGGNRNRKMTATIDEAKLKPAELRALLAEKYNFKEVTVREISNPYKTAEGNMAVRVLAEVKSIGLRVKSALMEFEVRLREGAVMTIELMGQIRARLESVFTRGKLGPNGEGNLLLTKELLMDLKSLHPDIEDVSVRVKGEAGDLQIGQNHNPEPGHIAAC